MAKVTGYFPTSAQPKLLPWRERKEQIRVIYTEFAVTRCDERRRLRKDLRKIMARYISARATWDVTPEKAELREWLQKVRAASADLAKLLSVGTKTGLAIAHEGDHWGTIEAQMLVVSNRAERGLLNLPDGAVREGDVPFRTLVAEVALLYAATRGKEAGISRSTRADGNVSLGGPFFRLMRALLTFIGLPDDRDDEAFGRALQRALNGHKGS